MRILHIGKYFPPFAGGIEAFTRDLCVQQSRDGHRVTALVHSVAGEKKMAPARIEGTHVIRAKVDFNLGFAPVALGYRAVLKRVLRATRPEIIHFHLPNPSALWAMSLSTARKCLWVAHWHSDIDASKSQRLLRLTYPVYRPWETAFLKRCDQIIATSPPYLDSSEPLQRFAERTTVIPLGIASERLAEQSEEVRWESTRGFRLLCVGRFSYYKALDHLIENVAAMDSVQLKLVGHGPAEEVLQAQIQRLGVNDRVQIHSNPSDDVRNALISQCDALVLASKERTEAFGVVLLEAMHFARPVIVADIPGSGAPWLVRTSGNGVVVPVGDHQALRKAIIDLANHPSQAHQLGLNGKTALESRFSIQRVAAAIDELYLSLASANAKR